jgi:hypothetical protein
MLHDRRASASAVQARAPRSNTDRIPLPEALSDATHGRIKLATLRLRTADQAIRAALARGATCHDPGLDGERRQRHDGHAAIGRVGQLPGIENRQAFERQIRSAIRI